MVHGDQVRFSETAQVTARQAALRLQDYIGARLLAADTLRHSLEEGEPLTEEAFRDRSVQIQVRFGGFLALNWIDPDGVIRWVAPLAANRAAEGRSVLDHPTAAPFFERSRTGSDIATSPLDLFQGLRGFATYLPIGLVGGTLNGVFDVERLVEDCFRSGLQDSWELGLDDGGLEAYRTAGFAEAPAKLESTAALLVLDRTWILRIRPQPGLVAAAHRGGAWNVLLSFGLLLALGLGLSLRMVLLRSEEKAESDRLKAEADRKTGLLTEELAEARRLESIGRLAGGVAHDFNNLLTTISGSAGLLMEDAGDNDEARGLLRDILEASRHGAELTGGLLAFARQQVLRPRSLDTRVELQRAEGLLARLVRADIRLEHHIAEELWPIEMDAGELSRVVVNLVANGVDAMPGGGHLTLRARNVTVAPGESPGPGEWVRIDVTDDGSGIPEDVRSRIFEPFFTTKEVGHGTGLGLASVYGAVRGAGGHVVVTSELHEGTTFSLFFPRSEVAPEPAPEPSGPLRGTGQRVLLVDDQEALRGVAAKMLQRAGYELIQAGDPDEALAISDGLDHLDVLVTDMVMPGGSGDELARAMVQRWPDLAVVYTSGYTRDSFDVHDLHGARATYLPKPFNRKELAAAVNTVLRGEAG